MGHSPRDFSESRLRREILICRRWMKAAKGGRRKRKEATPRSLAYEKTQRSHRLYLPKRDSRHAASRVVHRRRWPPSSTPSTSLRDTWAFGRGTQYAIHRDTHALTHARTQVCMTVRGRGGGERERGVAYAVGTEENVSRIPPPSQSIRANSLDSLFFSFFLFRPLRHQWRARARAHAADTRIWFERTWVRTHTEKKRYASENERKDHVTGP